MERDGIRVYLTEEDKKNFFLKQPDQELLRQEKEAYVASWRRAAVGCLAAVTISSVVEMRPEAYLQIGGGVIKWGALLLLMYCLAGYRRNLRSYRSVVWKQMDVRVKRKYPVETKKGYVTSNVVVSDDHFYPVEGEDIHTGYRSKVYLYEKQYRKVQMGDVLAVAVPL